MFAMATTEAKAEAASSSSCLSFLKDALLLPTQNAKLFVPVFLLLTLPTLLLQLTNVVAIQPLAKDLLLRCADMKNMDPTSPDYASLLERVIKEGKELVLITLAVAVVACLLSYAAQIVAFFAAATTHSGDRYSLPELFSRVIAKGHRFKGPLVTIAMAGTLNVACLLLLAVLLRELMTRFHLALPYAALVLALPFLFFLYLSIVLTVAVAVSAADAESRGASALGRAWRLMTRVWRKQGCALAIVVHLVAMAPEPLYTASLLCTKKSMPAVGMALLVVYALLSGMALLFTCAAATEYYYQAMESKEATTRLHHHPHPQSHGYVKIPNGGQLSRV